MSPTLKKSLSLILPFEGGYSNHPNDKGGPTNMGITQGVLSEYLGRPATVDDVKNLSRENAEKIYEIRYAKPCNIDSFKDYRVAAALLNSAINSGVGFATRMIQEIVGVKIDGVIGEKQSIPAINAADPVWLIEEIVQAQQRRYASIVKENRTQGDFIVGWINRSHAVWEFRRLPATNDVPVEAPKLEAPDGAAEGMPNYSGQRPKRSQLASLYGSIDPKTYAWKRQSEFMTRVLVPKELQGGFRYDGSVVLSVSCHKAMAGPLAAAFQNIIRRGLTGLVKEYNGCFNPRASRGSTKPSTHAYALALDINASTNGLGKKPTMSMELVKCFTDVGFVWGGTWKRPDGMHFQFVTEA
jgi:lysozyme family protein